jgi:hypothetical protein
MRIGIPQSEEELVKDFEVALKNNTDVSVFRDYLEINSVNASDSSVRGFDLTAERTRLYDSLLKAWFNGVVNSVKPDHRYALIAHAGQGRYEMCPASDCDVILLVDYPRKEDCKLEKMFSHPLIEFFTDRHKIKFNHITKNPESFDNLEFQDFSTFMDMRVLSGDAVFAEEIRQSIKEKFESSEFIFNQVRFWERKKGDFSDFGDLRFNLKIDRGSIRRFQSALWALYGADFLPTVELYRNASIDLVNGLEFLLKMRFQNNLRSRNDLMGRDDFIALGEENRRRLIEARRSIEQFAELANYRVKRDGIPMGNGIIYGLNGLRISKRFTERESNEKCNALYDLLKTFQTKNAQIDPEEYLGNLRNLKYWVRPGKGFSELFYSQGSLYSSLRTLYDLDVLGRLIEGFDDTEVKIPEETHRQPNITRGQFALNKIRLLEDIVTSDDESSFLDRRVAEEYNSINDDERAAIKLALLVKGIPRFDGSDGVREVSVEDYLDRMIRSHSFTRETAELAGFLIRNNNLLYKLGERGLNDENTVNLLINASGKKRSAIRALYVFNHCDLGSRDEIRDKSNILSNVDELVGKTINKLDGKTVEIKYSAYEMNTEREEILVDLGSSFKTSKYARDERWKRWINILTGVRAKTENSVFIEPVNIDGISYMGIATRDKRGLLSQITGAFYQSMADLFQVTAYTGERTGLALDFINFKFKGNSDKLVASIKDAVLQDRLPEIDKDEILGEIAYNPIVRYSPDSQMYTLRMNVPGNRRGLVHYLTRTLTEKCDASVYGLLSNLDKRTQSSITYTHFKSPHSLQEAESRIKEAFKK